MAQANRVHSTPRRIASKIDVPSGELVARDKRLALAYLRIEPFICDINNMAALAHDAVMNQDRASASKDANSLAQFAVFHLIDMIRDLHRRYREDDFDRSEKAVT
jgi:hypothetical protein